MILGLFAPVGLSPASRVVQAEDLNTGLLQVIVAMVSSNLALADHPSRVTVRLNDPLAFETALVSCREAWAQRRGLISGEGRAATE